jgi:hypothetical protein
LVSVVQQSRHPRTHLSLAATPAFSGKPHAQSTPLPFFDRFLSAWDFSRLHMYKKSDWNSSAIRVNNIIMIAGTPLTFDHMLENIECLHVKFEGASVVFVVFGLISLLSEVRRLVTVS